MVSTEIGRRPGWMPDAGVFQFVIDALDGFNREGTFGVDIDPYRMPEEWIPLIIVGAMDWIAISGWWPWVYTGVFNSNEAYTWVFVYQGKYEFDPDQLIVFREDEARNTYHQRIYNPGITDQERRELLQFIFQDVFDRWGVVRPPQAVVEPVVWATLMWVLSEHGKAWLAQDPVFASVYGSGVAYLSRWEDPPQLLDSNQMECTQRQVGSCSVCHQRLWCVMGFAIDDGWLITCNHCAVTLGSQGHWVDQTDDRIRSPKCGDDTCLFTACPHNRNVKSQEDIYEKFFQSGVQRVNDWRQQAGVAGSTPRELAGQSVQDIVDYFKQRPE